MGRDRGRQPERVVSDEGTLMKVYLGLKEAGVTGQQAIDAVSMIQNQGVLFRERFSDEEMLTRNRSVILTELYDTDLAINASRPDVSKVFKRTTHPGGVG